MQLEDQTGAATSFLVPCEQHDEQDQQQQQQHGGGGGGGNNNSRSQVGPNRTLLFGNKFGPKLSVLRSENGGGRHRRGGCWAAATATAAATAAAATSVRLKPVHQGGLQKVAPLPHQATGKSRKKPIKKPFAVN